MGLKLGVNKILVFSEQGSVLELGLGLEWALCLDLALLWGALEKFGLQWGFSSRCLQDSGFQLGFPPTSACKG